ncbi:MAG: ParB/RepB/Spo0J family partition protein [Thermus sp.]
MVPLEYLVLAPENSRTPDPQAVEALKASIRQAGLLQNLVGYEAGERILVVAGAHRLLALQALAREGHPVGEIPVQLVPREKALLLSAAENLARRDLTPLEEAETVLRLLEAGIPEEAAARELGRSLSFVRDRALVGRNLSPSWRPLLGAREIPFSLGLELARLPQKEQEELFQKWGKELRPEAVAAMRLKDAVPTSRLLPGVRERYLERGGVLEADLEGGEWAKDRKLALEVQREAAEELAQRLGGSLHLDLHPGRLVPGEGAVVVLNSLTLEVRVFTGMRLQDGGTRSQEEEAPSAPEPPVEAKEEKGPVGTRTEEERAREITGPAALEREALRIRAARERALADERYRKAALTLAVLASRGRSLEGKRAYFRTKGWIDFRPTRFHGGDAKLTERFQTLSGEEALLARLEALVGKKVAELGDLMALPEEVLDEAFRVAVALLLGQGEEVPTLGMADRRHLMGYSEAVLDQALAEVGRPGGKNKGEKAEKLLREGNQPFPRALLNAKHG